MKKTNIYYLIYASLGFVCLATLSLTLGCNNCNADYLLELPIAVYPQKDTFKIGDTLSFSSVFSNQIYNEGKDKTFYKIHNAKFQPIFIVSKYTEDSDVGLIEDSTLIISPEHDYRITYHADGGRTLSTEYLYDGNEYRLEFKVILKHKGLCFMRAAAFRGDAYSRNINFVEKCKYNSPVVCYFKLQDETNNNFEFFVKEMTYPALQKFKEEEFYNSHGAYTFVVTD